MGKRRTFTPAFKLQVVLELLSGVKSNDEICREHQLAPALVSAWREQFVERAPGIFATRQGKFAEQQRIADLERLVSRLTLELEVAKKASSILTSSDGTTGGRAVTKDL